MMSQDCMVGKILGHESLREPFELVQYIQVSNQMAYQRIWHYYFDYMQNFLAVPILAALRFGKWQNVIHLPLEKYTGTLIFVSHDRQLVSSLATQIIELDGQGGAEVYPGDYESYLLKRQSVL